MKNEERIQKTVVRQQKRFGCSCGKFTGALTVEVLRRRLKQEGIRVSSRDVFIRGVPIEIDLLVLKQNVRPSYGLVFEPEQVVAALEIKNSGSFGQDTIHAVRDNFRLINKANRRIRCCYVTLKETRSYKHPVTDKNSGGRAYTLLWWCGARTGYKTSAQWARLLRDLRRPLPARA